MTRRRLPPLAFFGLALFVGVAVAAPIALADGGAVVVGGEGRTADGAWRADVTLSDGHWRPGAPVQIGIALHFADTVLPGLAERKIKVDKLCVLVTAERSFDTTGFLRLPSDERMSTLLTPSGLAIEGGVQGAVTNRYGYAFRTPLDVLETLPVGEATAGSSAGTRTARFTASATLPRDLPPGLYRLRLDFGVMAGSRVYNLNGYSFAVRPFTDQAGTSTYFYSPTIPASGPGAAGVAIDATRLQARIPWLLLSDYNSNGYRGVVADQDRDRFATSDRSLIPDDVILPMYDDAGKKLSYSLEPHFPADAIDPLQNIPWDWSNGQLTVRVTNPDGQVTDLGTAPFVGRSGTGPTTGLAALKSWAPPAYGQYVVEATGWIADRWGRHYQGGGSYRFWIGRRMTLATATFQGMPFPVGARYGRDIQFNPAVPADVTVEARLYPGSDPEAGRVTTFSGKASSAGLYGAAQGMPSFDLDAPGEYWAHVRATYVDPEGHLWVCSVRHAGVVYAPGSAVVARGKKVVVKGASLDRGDTDFEGYVSADGESHLAHVGFPYQAGDMLLIAAEGQGANKIEPVLTYQMQGDAAPWDTRLNGVGTTNLSIKTSNGYSPHLFPEYITDLEYYYGAAPRPGFMGRFLVGESTVRAPYWPTSPNSFGGQIGASPNGDTPGDIYRLLGGVVLRRAGQAPLYAGYLANAFILPKGSNNNRVVAAGAEDLVSATGARGRFFLVGLRPGTAYEQGATFRPALQIDPMVPASIHFELDYPDGRRQVADGTGDATGSFAGPTAWPLDVPGVYRYRVRGSWNGFEGRMPGLPESGGEFYVYTKAPAGAARLRLDGATTRTFPAAGSLTFTGTSTAAAVHYALITPGAVIEQGELPVSGGRFQYVVDPAAIHARVPMYDIVSVTTGKPQIGRVLHLTFFSAEKGGVFDLQRVIVRGTSAVAPRSSAAPST
ncbi:MAG: hypothetical protein NDJ94_23775, partial [Vicinamibacteria bacterium]|nr:hypothetical protein [Vicinamibacteria bacterium]